MKLKIEKWRNIDEANGKQEEEKLNMNGMKGKNRKRKHSREMFKIYENWQHLMKWKIEQTVFEWKKRCIFAVTNGLSW